MHITATIAAFFLFAIVLPTLRLRLQTGTWAIVFLRGADPFQRLIGAAFAAYLGGVAAWAVLYAAVGPAPLDVYRAPAAVTAAGWALIAVGFAIILVAQAAMGASWRVGIDDRKTALVTGGPFRLVRNPIFSAMLATLAGLVLVTPSPWTIMGWIGAALLLAIETRLEEQHLVGTHGDEYRVYAARVGRFVPGIGRLSASPSSPA